MEPTCICKGFYKPRHCPIHRTEIKTRTANMKDWDLITPDRRVYCGRGKGEKRDPWKCEVGEDGYFGNPFVVGEECYACGKVHKSGGSTLVCYRGYLEDRLLYKEFYEAFYALKGKVLVCFCKPNPCHTDVMVAFLESDIRPYYEVT